MSDWYGVQIKWRKAEEGGRKRPPSGPVYTTVARFAETDPTQEWSVILQFEQSNEKSLCVDGRVRFLTDEAPFDLLASTIRFVLVEGPNVVADVQVLADQDIIGLRDGGSTEFFLSR